MSKSKHSSQSAPRKNAKPIHEQTPQKKAKKASKFRLPLLPVPIVVFLLVWFWIACWQGDVFRMVRENSFFAADETLMQFELQKPYGILWTIGRALLTPFRYPWLGGLLLSFILTASCWLWGYAMRFSARLRWIQYLPLGIFTGIFTYQGVSNWFEAESGHVMGIPLLIFLILCVWGIIIRSFSRKPVPAFITVPKDETRKQNWAQTLTALLMLVIPMVYAHHARPYVRPLASMQVAVMNQDWQRVIDIAHDNAEVSNRPMAAQYAMALVQTNQIGERLFDIRLDYDSIYSVALNGGHNPTNVYLMEADYHAGLVQTSYHHAMESMAMEGPTVRNLKTLCKTSLMRGEWEVADKYLTILDKVPFEGDFVTKYRPMVGDTARINADPEMAMVRLTEPIHDLFENNLIQPSFLGYNAILVEGRSINALYNSLMVNIYTKAMDAFIMRCQPLRGKTPPTSIAEALTMMGNKYPELSKSFNFFDLYRGRMAAFINDNRQWMSSSEERAKHARELFPKYKGYYPYYYFFGNLKATKKKSDNQSSNAGVN